MNFSTPNNGHNQVQNDDVVFVSEKTFKVFVHCGGKDN